MHVVINHLRLRDPVSETTVEAAREAVQLVVDAGAHAARVAKVDDKHLILILEFSTADDADRISRDRGTMFSRIQGPPSLHLVDGNGFTSRKRVRRRTLAWASVPE